MSWVVPSLVVWVEVELSWDWVELRMGWTGVKIELKVFCLKMIMNSNKLELSSAKLSSFSWGWVEIELSWGWAGVKIELRLSLESIWTLQLRLLKSSIELFEVFNWSIWSLQLKYLKSCSILLLSRLGGWVEGCVIRK